MSDNRATRENRQELDKTSKAKKSYQKPAFRYERVFETLALSCGKIAGTSVNCNSQPKSS